KVVAVQSQRDVCAMERQFEEEPTERSSDYPRTVQRKKIDASLALMMNICADVDLKAPDRLRQGRHIAKLQNLHLHRFDGHPGRSVVYAHLERGRHMLTNLADGQRPARK